MSWIEDEAARQATFRANLSEAWAALKAALARDIADYRKHFGLHDVETKERGDDGYWIMFQEGTDRLSGRRDIHVTIDFEKLRLTVAITQTRTKQDFKVVPDANGFPVFERLGKRYSVDEVSREILKPHLSKVG
jgi:hypothetical protein